MVIARKSVLVVGAGFAGAVFARELAESGFTVSVIDRRPHLAGNAYDEATPCGVRIHRYGPHLFHTSNAEVFDWLTRFGEFVPYEHRVEAVLGLTYVPLPVNRRTIGMVFKVTLNTEEDVKIFLRQQSVPTPAPRNAAEHLNSQIGPVLTELFFRPYTKKMWGMDLEEIDASVVKRIPIRTDDEDRYFPNDRFQVLPRDGYTAIFQKIFAHPRIEVALSQGFDISMLGEYDYCFNSMAIDEFFANIYGPLPYRSIRFHHEMRERQDSRGSAATINFTDDSPFTRETDWSRLPAHLLTDGPLKIVTREEPCDYRNNGLERYYPIKASDGRYDTAYRRYKALANKLNTVTFIGRCGTYQYLDMDQVINQSLLGARRWIATAS